MSIFATGNNHIFIKFTFCKNILQMLAYSRNANTKELCHSLLRTPECFVLYYNLHFAVSIGHIVKQKLYFVTHYLNPTHQVYFLLSHHDSTNSVLFLQSHYLFRKYTGEFLAPSFFKIPISVKCFKHFSAALWRSPKFLFLTSTFRILY